jgi:hypothetical protein
MIHGIQLFFLHKSAKRLGYYQLVWYYYLQGLMNGKAMQLGLQAEQASLV